MGKPPFRHVDFLPVNLSVENRQDGVIILENMNPMGDPPPNLIEPLRRHAEEIPDSLWLAERPDGELQQGVWDELTYAEGWAKVSALAGALASRGLQKGQTVMILSGNSIPHALMNFATILAGGIVVPVSEAWSLLSSDHAKLRYALNLIEPAFIFAQDSKRFEKALAVPEAENIPTITAGKNSDASALRLEDLVQESHSALGEELFAALEGDMTAKYLFTSGSTGMPKAVINTHSMMCINAVMAKKLVREKEGDPSPCMLSWLPWSHTFGGNAIMNNLMVSGGTLYLDRGRPLPGRFEETIFNLREIAPTTYSNVPLAYGWLADALEADTDLAGHFFSRLRSMAYGGAALGQEMADRMQKIAVDNVGERILFTSGYGATETAPGIMSVHWETEQMGLLGLPLPGVEIKLQPVGSKMEVRVRGACITPGYYRDEEKTKAAFDEEGFYRLGDAARFVDAGDPEKGLVFDGRVVEDFKLASGTWVSAGPLRLSVIDAAAPLLRDAVIAGLDEDFISVLGFPDFTACAEFAGLPTGAPPEEILANPALAERLQEMFISYNQAQTGSSTRIGRLLLQSEPPSMDASEITDKGYINQAAVLNNRAGEVARLYASTPDKSIIIARAG